ncbi:hypothetical protein GQ53DRAFT_505480 [Thozetella sp. PMI_491]|nr:hypothetical protein GQ53DRAFT_505480 [Thozetella sp. PMI_491]
MGRLSRQLQAGFVTAAPDTAESICEKAQERHDEGGVVEGGLNQLLSPPSLPPSVLSLLPPPFTAHIAEPCPQPVPRVCRTGETECKVQAAPRLLARRICAVASGGWVGEIDGWGCVESPVCLPGRLDQSRHSLILSGRTVVLPTPSLDGLE